jgi:rubrerythrin
MLNALALFLVIDRKDKRSQETMQTLLSASRLEVAGIVERLANQAEMHREEVQTLCQRIQAPEVAVMQHQIDTAGPPEATMPLTDEESASRYSAELLQRIREIEEAEAA